MKKLTPVGRIARNAMMLALLCVIGMFSIPMGENVKVSLQLLMVFLLALTAEAFYDAMIVTSLYLVLGLFLPIYAGFNAGISPTFGYVIAFIGASPAIYFMNRIPKLHALLRMSLACVVGLLIVYVIGTVFMMAYLSRWDFGWVLTISVVPYLPFDAIKIVLAVLVTYLLPRSVGGAKPSSEKKDASEE